MESSGSDQSLLVAELCHIKELVRQLEDHMDQPSPIEFCKSLTPEINLSLEKSISMAKKSNSTCRMESPCSVIGSPRSETSDQPFKYHDPREKSKKRKTLPKWRSQVKVSPGGGVEGPLDDGYSWRKYGQKHILGAKFPRGYYRCTHRNTCGCLATKQVQRTDENPSIFEVTYHGTHTCHQRPKSVPASATGKQEQQQQKQQKHQQPDLLQSFRASLEVKAEDLDSEAKEWNSMSFSLSSTPAGSSVMPDDNIFCSPLTLDDLSQFLLPAPSELNYFSMSACQMSSCRGGPGLHKSESDLTEVISAATSTNDSPMADMDFMLEQFNFDPNFFQIDASSFFP
ncbi:probable WRKY transcription factor 53 isoform X1 [Typha angustifolia]|uniref:probable WRKY transcription factor 53 isoform X1 n=1 Tax=Typha angustifolia TaxID=59011 RepID=UPI003C308B3E